MDLYMNIIITFKENSAYHVEYITFDNHIIATSNDIVAQNGETIMKNVSLRNTMTGESSKQNVSIGIENVLRCSVLTDIQVRKANEKSVHWVEIISIKIENGNNCYELYSQQFEKYQMRNIIMNEFHYVLNEADYQKIAAYVRMQDKRDNAINAVMNDDSLDKNVITYLTENVLDDFAENFDAVTDYTGEDELSQIDDYIKNKCGGVVYPVFISNAGTDDEIKQTVPLLRSQYKKICEDMREYWNGDPGPEEWGSEWPVLYDTEGDDLSLEFVDEIILSGTCKTIESFKKPNSPKISGESMTFESPEVMLSTIQSGIDLYNINTLEYVFVYNEEGSIAVYGIEKWEALELEKASKASEERWSAFLGVGGAIWDDPSHKSFIEGNSNLDFCKTAYKEKGWINVTPK